ncbi:MAG: RepB family DNA primase [Gammaproteobacteria bacterium]|nr:RepB family DNA primase [Gammaproteobacteria bacterium]
MMEKPFRYVAVVEKQLRAMETSRFDLRIVNPQGRVVEQRDELFLVQVKEILEWLNEKNAKGNRIEFRPHGEHGLSLVSGLNHAQVQRARLSGCEPALVVACGPNQFQIWLKHDRKLPAAAAARASGHLCHQLGGDCAVSGWDSFGYLAGFLLPAADGPFRVELVAHSGEVFSTAAALNDRLATPTALD